MTPINIPKALGNSLDIQKAAYIRFGFMEAGMCEVSIYNKANTANPKQRNYLGTEEEYLIWNKFNTEIVDLGSLKLKAK
jgi:hypothetical protein